MEPWAGPAGLGILPPHLQGVTPSNRRGSTYIPRRRTVLQTEGGLGRPTIPMYKNTKSPLHPTRATIDSVSGRRRTALFRNWLRVSKQHPTQGLAQVFGFRVAQYQAGDRESYSMSSSFGWRSIRVEDSGSRVSVVGLGVSG